MYKELLLDFMRMKSIIVESFTSIPCFTELDYEEVKKWPESICKSLFIDFGHGDVWSCPWCLLTDVCKFCGYGKRHGICIDEYDSLYQHQLRNVEMIGYTHISSLPGMSELIELTLKEYRKLKHKRCKDIFVTIWTKIKRMLHLKKE